MPTLRVSPAEAKRLNATRRRNEAHNRVIGLVVDRLKARRARTEDPIELAITEAILHDVRRMVRA